MSATLPVTTLPNTSESRTEIYRGRKSGQTLFCIEPVYIHPIDTSVPHTDTPKYSLKRLQPSRQQIWSDRPFIVETHILAARTFVLRTEPRDDAVAVESVFAW